ncbi:MAG: YchF family ATPase [Planctomycetes bacterium]|nr:YchF family ATPase [Planctomycetota bacterium]
MRIAIVGFPLSGKTTLFTAITGVPHDHLHAAEENLAAIKVPEPRLDLLFEIFKPKRRVEATTDFVDLPGSAEGDVERAGLTKHLPTLRQSDALVLLLRGFESASVPMHQGRVDPQSDLTQLRDEMLLADLEICATRIAKLEKAIAKPTKDRDQQKHELALLQRCSAALEDERPLSDLVQPGDEEKLARSFGFLTQKPVVTVINVGEADIGKEPPFRDRNAAVTYAVCAALEAELLQMEPAERREFMDDWGVQALVRDRLVRACFNALGMICFMTGGGKDEVRAWAIPKNSTALVAAGKIHTDMARGFIRAETVAYEDLRAAGTFREAKAAGKVRQEPKSYVVQDGDVITFKFNV